MVASNGVPSWSYDQVEEETADRVHALVPVTAMDCTGEACATVSERYSSTYTACPTPCAMAVVPAPTRTTATLPYVKVAAEASAGSTASQVRGDIRACGGGQ